MHRTRPRLHRRASSLLAAALALAAAACTDRANPLAPGPGAGPGGGTPGTPVTIQTLECNASTADLTVRCAPIRPGESDARGIIVGNQGVYVQVTSSNVAYNGGTGQFTFDVTLQNLIEQKLGTTDGTTVDPNGIRIFFHSGPTVTSGVGVASVLPDGFGTFTAAGQPYYQYNQLLANAQTSTARGWTLIMPPTVLTFSFLLYVAAPVEYPNGYVTMDGNLPGASYGYFHPGDTHPVVAVAKTAVGNVIPAAVITFGTTDANCATVSGGGTVTGVSAATCSITASSGGLATGSLSFAVSGTTRTWTGATSSDWNLGTNWGGGRVPAAADSVSIPTGVPNFPALTSAVSIRGVTVADAATLSLGAFNLTANDNVATGPTAGSGILSTTGTLVLASTSGTSTVHGRIPTFLVTGVYTLDGDVSAIAKGQVDLGKLVSPNYNLQVSQ
ncbi:MAG TPA: hypothetical protein VGO40_02900 [Longimicrobium sp.]|jgi:hypothetical protein|nr:hypothetical protein [Longimicrobium sp.]